MRIVTAVPPSQGTATLWQIIFWQDWSGCKSPLSISNPSFFQRRQSEREGIHRSFQLHHRCTWLFSGCVYLTLSSITAIDYHVINHMARAENWRKKVSQTCTLAKIAFACPEKQAISLFRDSQLDGSFKRRNVIARWALGRHVYKYISIQFYALYSIHSV